MSTFELFLLGYLVFSGVITIGFCQIVYQVNKELSQIEEPNDER